jgi:hypothetical protein
MLMDHPDVMRRLAELRVERLRADAGKRAPFVIDTPAISRHTPLERAPLSFAGRLGGWLTGPPARELA